jgi:hypothetical protein
MGEGNRARGRGNRREREQGPRGRGRGNMRDKDQGPRGRGNRGMREGNGIISLIRGIIT